jgi:hypothetical protein
MLAVPLSKHPQVANIAFSDSGEALMADLKGSDMEDIAR